MKESIRKLDDIIANIRESRAVMDELSIDGVSLGMSEEQIDREISDAIEAHIDMVLESRVQEMLR